MWKITTRGFTLEEVLIMAAMYSASHMANARTGVQTKRRPGRKFGSPRKAYCRAVGHRTDVNCSTPESSLGRSYCGWLPGYFS